MKKYLIYGLMALAMTVISCNDFLDVKPQSQIPTEDLFLQESGYEDALMGCYVKMTSDDLYGRFLTLEGVDFMAQYYDVAPVSSMQGSLREFAYKNEYAELQLKQTYNAFYNAILHTNEVITHIDKPEAQNVVKSEIKRNLIKGEALGLRAFLHFDLQRLFGQLPQNATKLVSLPYSETTGVEARPLYDYNAYMNKVLADLSEAEELLKDDPAITHNMKTVVHEDIDDKFFHYRKLRFNYFAVKALQARIYLYMGENAKAHDIAKEIIDLKEPDGSSYFTLAGEEDLKKGNFALPTETIFGLSSIQLESPEYEQLFKSISTSSYMQFSVQRKNEMFQGRNTATNNRFSKMWGEQRASTGVKLIYYKKYLQDEGYISSSDKMEMRWFYPMFRLSEMYLILLETSEDLAEVNDRFYTYMVARNEQPGAFQKLEDARAEVVNEYRREFMGEGQMFFTYKRLGSENMLWRLKAVGEECYVVPVPASELTK